MRRAFAAQRKSGVRATPPDMARVSTATMGISVPAGPQSVAASVVTLPSRRSSQTRATR